jgi:hypothetical protein
LVQEPVVGKEQMGTPAHAHAPTQLHPARSESVILLEELDEVEDHAVAQQAPSPLVQDPRRDLVQHEFGVAHVDCVTRVRTSLISNDCIDLLGQNVDDLPLPLVTPLAPHHDHTVALGRPRTSAQITPVHAFRLSRNPARHPAM